MLLVLSRFRSRRMVWMDPEDWKDRRMQGSSSSQRSLRDGSIRDGEEALDSFDEES